uniref:non-specific serine/threonine protein kinase n=1 Tax=Toxoplasma gondii COUG TaxID=1074873 RepID=A0A2G8Y5I7_TOXGO|nr:calcium-dependent protein kinase [Toxoplasma gondii COUG]
MLDREREKSSSRSELAVNSYRQGLASSASSPQADSSEKNPPSVLRSCLLASQNETAEATKLAQDEAEAAVAAAARTVSLITDMSVEHQRICGLPSLSLVSPASLSVSSPAFSSHTAPPPLSTSRCGGGWTCQGWEQQKSEEQTHPKLAAQFSQRSLREELVKEVRQTLEEERRRVTTELEKQRQHLLHHEGELSLLHCQLNSALREGTLPPLRRHSANAKAIRATTRVGSLSPSAPGFPPARRKVLPLSSLSPLLPSVDVRTQAWLGQGETQQRTESPGGDSVSQEAEERETKREENDEDSSLRTQDAGAPAHREGELTQIAGEPKTKWRSEGEFEKQGEEPNQRKEQDTPDVVEIERKQENSSKPEQHELQEGKPPVACGQSPSQQPAREDTAKGDVLILDKAMQESKGDLPQVKAPDVECRTEKKGQEKRIYTAKDSIRMSTRTDFKQASAVLRHGDSLLRNYVVKQKVGSGTWGDVFIAVERASGLQRAVKRVSKRSVRAMEHAEDEVLLLQRLDHPNIIKVYECFEDYTYVYIVMELCRGGDLYDAILRRMPFDEVATAVLMHQIFSAVHYCHCKYVAHRDIKPENFLLTHPDSFRLKLIDFGLARSFLYDPEELPPRTKLGTMHFAAPELLLGYDGRYADSWSCGVLMYLLLSGELPFDGRTDADVLHRVLYAPPAFTGEIWNSISSAAKDLICRLLTVPPSSRLLPGEALRHPFFHVFLPHTIPLPLYASPGPEPRRHSLSASQSFSSFFLPFQGVGQLFALTRAGAWDMATEAGFTDRRCLFSLVSREKREREKEDRSLEADRALPSSREDHDSLPPRESSNGLSYFSSASPRVSLLSSAPRRCRSDAELFSCAYCGLDTPGETGRGRERNLGLGRDDQGAKATDVYPQDSCRTLFLLSSSEAKPMDAKSRLCLADPTRDGLAQQGSAQALDLPLPVDLPSLGASITSYPQGPREERGNEDEAGGMGTSSFALSASRIWEKILGERKTFGRCRAALAPHSPGFIQEDDRSPASNFGTNELWKKVPASVVSLNAHRQALPPCASAPHLLGARFLREDGTVAFLPLPSLDVLKKKTAAEKKAKRGTKKNQSLDPTQAAALLERIGVPFSGSRSCLEDSALEAGNDSSLASSPVSDPSLSTHKALLGSPQMVGLSLVNKQRSSAGSGGRQVLLANEHDVSEANLAQHEWQTLLEEIAEEIGDGGDSLALTTAYICWCRAPSQQQRALLQGAERTGGPMAPKAKDDETAEEPPKRRTDGDAPDDTRGDCDRLMMEEGEDEEETEEEPSEDATVSEDNATSDAGESPSSSRDLEESDEKDAECGARTALSPAFAFPAVSVPPVFHPQASWFGPRFAASCSTISSLGSTRDDCEAGKGGAASEKAGKNKGSDTHEAEPLRLVGSNENTTSSLSDAATLAALAAVTATQFLQPTMPFYPLGEMRDPPEYPACGTSQSPSPRGVKPPLVYSPRTCPVGSAAVGRGEALGRNVQRPDRPSGRQAGQGGKGRPDEGRSLRANDTEVTFGRNGRETPLMELRAIGAQAAAATVAAFGGLYLDQSSWQPVDRELVTSVCGEKATRSKLRTASGRGHEALPEHPLSSLLSVRAGSAVSPSAQSAGCGVGALSGEGIPGRGESSERNGEERRRRQQEQELNFLLCSPMPHFHLPSRCENCNKTLADTGDGRQPKDAFQPDASSSSLASSTGPASSHSSSFPSLSPSSIPCSVCTPFAARICFLSPQDVKLFPFCPLAPILVARWLNYAGKTVLQKKCASTVVEISRGEFANVSLLSASSRPVTLAALRSGTRGAPPLAGGRGRLDQNCLRLAAGTSRETAEKASAGGGASCLAPVPALSSAEAIERSDCAVEQLQRLEGLFVLLDRDGDGQLTLAETVDGVRRLAELLRFKLKVDLERKKEAKDLARQRERRLEKVAKTISAAKAMVHRQKEFLDVCQRPTPIAIHTLHNKGRVSILSENTGNNEQGDRRRRAQAAGDEARREAGGETRAPLVSPGRGQAGRDSPGGNGAGACGDGRDKCLLGRKTSQPGEGEEIGKRMERTGARAEAISKETQALVCGIDNADRLRAQRRRERRNILATLWQTEDAGVLLEACLRACDTNGDGVLDLSEFLTACVDERIFARQDLLKAAFRKLDLDGDGVISVDEMGAALGWIETCVDDSCRSELVREHHRETKEAQTRRRETKAQIAELLNSGDFDNDGKFSFKDFVACLGAP